MSASSTDGRIPMPNWNRFYHFPYALHNLGDWKLPRPITPLELLVSLATAIFVASRIILPVLGSTYALGLGIVILFFMPGLMSTAQALCGRKIHQEILAFVKFTFFVKKLYITARPARRRESARMRVMFDRERVLAGSEREQWLRRAGTHLRSLVRSLHRRLSAGRSPRTPAGPGRRWVPGWLASRTSTSSPNSDRT